jgi:hypothetical protein
LLRAAVAVVVATVAANPAVTHLPVITEMQATVVKLAVRVETVVVADLGMDLAQVAQDLLATD